MTEPYNHPAAIDPERLLAECEARRLRRSGPGGQHRNKVETAVRLQHLPTGVCAEANERRSQSQNHAVALFRLRSNLALQYRVPCGGDYAPSPLWRSRCGGRRLLISAAHADFPALLAEALDVLAAHHADLAASATALGCSPSQLTRFLKHDPRALALVNRWRVEHGLHTLR